MRRSQALGRKPGLNAWHFLARDMQHPPAAPCIPLCTACLVLCRHQASIKEAQAHFNQHSWQPSMMGLRALFGNLWPSPQAEVRAPAHGLLTLLLDPMQPLKLGATLLACAHARPLWSDTTLSQQWHLVPGMREQYCMSSKSAQRDF